MQIRKIMVPLIGRYEADVQDDLGLASLRAGFALARRLNAHVEVCCLAASLDSAYKGRLAGLYEGAVAPLLSQIDDLNQKSFWHARGLFDQVAQEFLPERAAVPGDEPAFSAAVVDVAGDLARTGAIRARLADLTVMASAPGAFEGTYQEVVNGLLAMSGRPLLIVPDGTAAPIWDHVAVAWNGTMEATRAVAMATNCLEAASRVTILTIPEGDHEDPPAADLAESLRWHGIDAVCREVPRSGENTGICLQRAALEEGADLLLMGAYTRSRTQRFLYGGATGGVLRQPLLSLMMLD